MNSQVSTGWCRNVGAKLWSHWKLKALGQVPLVRNYCRFKMNILEDTFLNNGMNWAICHHETWQWLQWFCRSGPKAVPPPSLPQRVKQVDESSRMKSSKFGRPSHLTCIFRIKCLKVQLRCSVAMFSPWFLDTSKQRHLFRHAPVGHESCHSRPLSHANTCKYVKKKYTV